MNTRLDRIAKDIKTMVTIRDKIRMYFDWYPISNIQYAYLYDKEYEFNFNFRIPSTTKRLSVFIENAHGGKYPVVTEIDRRIVDEMTDENGIVYELIKTDSNPWKRVEDRINTAAENYVRKLG